MAQNPPAQSRTVAPGDDANLFNVLAVAGADGRNVGTNIEALLRAIWMELRLLRVQLLEINESGVPTTELEDLIDETNEETGA